MTTDAPPLTAAEPCSSWEAPHPVLFNPWKHHAGFLRRQIEEAVRDGDPGLDVLVDRLVVVGANLMDLYTGKFTPAELSARVFAQLRDAGRQGYGEFRAWVDAGGGYGTLTLEDGSAWVLRRGDAGGRYVHLHPGRWVPHTKRVRANVVKTAVAVLAYRGVHGGDAMDREFVNLVRAELLGLPPMGREVSGDGGLGEVVALLQRGAA